MTTASFPTVHCYISFTSASVQYGFLFDDTVWGKFDTGTFGGTQGGTQSASDLIADLRSATITPGGRQRQIEAFAAGTCSVVLDNNLGWYDPDNPASPFYDTGAVIPGTLIQPMRLIQITATWAGITYDLFTGYLDRIAPDYALGAYSDAWVTLTATDGMKVLQNIRIDSVRPIETTQARVAAILTAAGWSTTLRKLHSNGQQLQAATLSGNAAAEIQTCMDSEYGRFYIDGSGRVVTESRSSRNRVQTSSTTWKDTGTSGLIYSSIQREMDDELIRNRITVTNVGGTAQISSDATSLSVYQQRTFTFTNALLRTNQDAKDLANILLYIYKDVQGCRFPSIMFDPVSDPSVLWPEVLGRAVSDRVNVTVTPPGVGAMTTGAYVEGISHQINTVPQSWVTQFHASRQQPTTFIQFDDATYGKTFASSSTAPAGSLQTFAY